MPQKFCANTGGRLRTGSSIEELVRLSGTSAAIEVFEMISLGKYRRRFEIEKVEIDSKSCTPDIGDGEDEDDIP